MRIIDNIEIGDCILGYEVRFTHNPVIVMIALTVGTIYDAINRYYKDWYKQYGEPTLIQYHKYSKEDLEDLSKCA